MYMGDGDNLHRPNPFLTSTVFDWSTYAYVTSLIALYLGDDARYGIQLLFNAWLLENRMCAHERVHVIFNSNRRCRITSGLLAYRSIKTFPNQNVSPKTMVVNTNTYRKFLFFWHLRIRMKWNYMLEIWYVNWIYLYLAKASIYKLTATSTAPAGAPSVFAICCQYRTWLT